MSVIHHLEFYVENLSETRVFWQSFLKDLNFELYQEFHNGVSFIHHEGMYIVFVQVALKNKSKYDRQSSGLNHIAFSVKSSEELEKFHQNLLSKRIAILKKTKDHLCFEDCNQFAVELFVNNVE